MKRTRVCMLFDIQWPIIQGGMIWVSGAKLAAAVSEAGGLGLIGAGSMDADLLRLHIQKARRLTRRPFGVNLPVFKKDAEALADVILEQGVKIVFTSGGSPKRFTPAFKDAGITVAHVTATPELAFKCQQAGVDAVVCEGFEAGGHNGRDELTTMTLVPQCVDAVTIPVIAAGGIADGRQALAAFALGAEGVQVGSRFAVTIEASSHPSFKKAVIEAGSTDTHLVMKPLMPVRLMKNAFCRQVIDAEAGGVDVVGLSGLLGRGRAKLGMLDGDIDEGELEIGQVSGMIRDEPSAAEIVRRFIDEYKVAREKV